MKQKCNKSATIAIFAFFYKSWSFQSNLAHTPSAAAATTAAEAAAAAAAAAAAEADAAEYSAPDMLPLQRKLLFVPHIIDVDLQQHRMSASGSSSSSSSSKVHACHATLHTPSALS
jgi:hypothetical protein